MKLIPILVCSAVAALALPACSTMTKKEECPPKGSSCCSAKGASKAHCDTHGKKQHR